MTTIFCILAFVCGFIVYRTGFKDGQRVSDGGKIKSLIPKKVKVTDEEKRIREIAFLEYEINEIESAKLIKDEDVTLDE